MYALILILHVVVCFLLITVILVQGGRGGMAEALGGSGSQSLFGGGANVVMTKVTAVGAAIFMVTCVSLALLSTHRGRSVIEQMRLAPAGGAGILPPPVSEAADGGLANPEVPQSRGMDEPLEPALAVPSSP